MARRAIEAIARSELVVVTDDEVRENEADLIGSADLLTTAQVAFIVRHTTGIVCAPMPGARVDALELPPMVSHNCDPNRTAFTVSVDLRTTGTGVSAVERCLTLRALAREGDPAQFRRPGHVFPLRARDGGVLERAGHTEAAVDLCRHAGLSGVGVLSELVADDGSMLRGARAARFAKSHGLAMVAISDLRALSLANRPAVKPVAESILPTRHGDFRVIIYHEFATGADHLALIHGRPGGAGAPALVRVHSECLTGDLLGSLRCDCGSQLDHALQLVGEADGGAVIYLRGQEGRGIGLKNKIDAYKLQDGGLDTVDANIALGLPVDARSYSTAAAILHDLSICAVRLITNNDRKKLDLQRSGIEVVEQIFDRPTVTTYNEHYLRTKRDRMGHHIVDLV